MSYADANFVIAREECCAVIAGGGATTEYNKFRAFQSFLLKKVHAAVVVAGTATGHGFDIYSGTTSVGTIPLGTAAAGSVVHSALLNLPIASMAQISVKSLADVVGQAQIVYEYHTIPDSPQTL